MTTQSGIAAALLSGGLPTPPNLFSVTYDLRQSGQDYAGLASALENMKAIRIQQSHWWVRSYRTASDLRADLLPSIDWNDSLMVAQLGEVAGWETDPDLRLWMETYLAFYKAA